jgi:hypothetical protein
LGAYFIVFVGFTLWVFGEAFSLSSNARHWAIIALNCRDEKVLGDAWDGGDRISLARLFKYFNDHQLKVPGSSSSPPDQQEQQGGTGENVEALKSRYKKILGSSPHTDWGEYRALATIARARACV